MMQIERLDHEEKKVTLSSLPKGSLFKFIRDDGIYLKVIGGNKISAVTLPSGIACEFDRGMLVTPLTGKLTITGRG